MKLRFSAILSLLGTIWLTSLPAEAARIYVNASNSGGSQDGSSWIRAFSSLGKAIETASPGDQIWVAAGVYYPDEGFSSSVNDDPASTFLIDKNLTILGGFKGNESLSFIRNPEQNLTVLSGDIAQDDDGSGVPLSHSWIVGTNANTVVTLGPNASGSLCGFTVVAAKGDGAVGILSNGSDTVISECSVRFCSNTSASIPGAGMRFLTHPTSNGTPQLVDSRISDCIAEAAGGGVFVEDVSMEISGTSLSRNESKTTGGGGLYVQHTAAANLKLEVRECDFIDNEFGSLHGSGGAIHFVSSASEGVLSITGCRFRGNLTNGNGFQRGGAIYVEKSIIEVENSCFRGNSTNADGGALHLVSSDGKFTNVHISGNESDLQGGGISAVGSGLILKNCTIAVNRAVNGGGIFLASSSAAALSNCILWNNAGGFPNQEVHTNAAGLLTVFEFHSSIVKGLDLSAMNDNLDGSGNANDPMFENAQISGPWPFTAGDFRLDSGSPLIDRGDNSRYDGPATDIDGGTRIVATNFIPATIDLGAYEVGGRLADDGDIDNDGMADAFEATWSTSATAMSALDDPDSDGISNLIEYCLGQSPLQWDPFPLSITFGPINTDHPIVTYPFDTDSAEFATLRLERVNDASPAYVWDFNISSSNFTDIPGVGSVVIRRHVFNPATKFQCFRLHAEPIGF